MEYVPRFTNQSRVPHGKLGLAMTALFILGLGLIASSSVDWFSPKRLLRNRFCKSGLDHDPRAIRLARP
jgi:hypothetical protein